MKTRTDREVKYAKRNEKIIFDDMSFTISKSSIIKAISMMFLIYIVLILANIAAFTDGRTTTNILMIIAIADVIVFFFTIGILQEIIKKTIHDFS